MRALKRRLSDIVYRRMVDDAITTTVTGPGGHWENVTSLQRDRLAFPHRLFGSVTSRTRQPPAYDPSAGGPLTQRCPYEVRQAAVAVSGPVFDVVGGSSSVGFR
jgi:hypothetical protein